MQASQDSFTSKRLLYRFDKKIQQVFHELYLSQYGQNLMEGTQMIDQKQREEQQKINSSKAKRLSKEQVLELIDELQFQNFKYRTALVSAQKDQQFNQSLLKQSQLAIQSTKQEVKSLTNEFEQALIVKKNKAQYNQLIKSLKSYETNQVQDNKISQIQEQIKTMQEKYTSGMQQYAKRQKCLKHALSALRCFLDSSDRESGINHQGGSADSNGQNKRTGTGSTIGVNLGMSPLNTLNGQGKPNGVGVGETPNRSIKKNGYKEAIAIDSDEGQILY